MSQKELLSIHRIYEKLKLERIEIVDGVVGWGMLDS